MRILHTADLHLRNYRDERWSVLQNLLELGKGEKIDVFVICGDLFDGNTDSESLRPHIRKLFSGNGFHIVILPGNHDENAFREGLYYGKDVSVIMDYKNPFVLGDVRIWGIPFEQMAGTELLQKIHALSKELKAEKNDILLFHGELLDTFYSRSDFGEEGNERYMPLKLSYLKGINIEYILAGHFHKNFDIRNLPEGGYFVYPGSPISISQKETGRRKVNIFNIGEAPNEYLLDSLHYQTVTIELEPFSDEDPFQIVKDCVGGLHSSARLLLTVKGYVNSNKIMMNEKEIVLQMEKILDERCVVRNYEFKDIKWLFEDELFRKFRSKLDERVDNDEKKFRLLKIAIAAMMEAGI
jgi:DNA repair exonuclease SbcCD nuclease subunit